MPRPGVHVDPGAKSIAENLRRLRQERGVTQVDLAAKLGVTQQIVSDYERAQLRLHGQVIVKIARILGVTSDQLLGLNGDPSANTAKNRQFVRRLQKIDILSKRDQQALLKTIDAFLAKAS